MAWEAREAPGLSDHKVCEAKQVYEQRQLVSPFQYVQPLLSHGALPLPSSFTLQCAVSLHPPCVSFQLSPTFHVQLLPICFLCLQVFSVNLQLSLCP